MPDLVQAHELITNAEAGMRALMARALAEHRYQDVAEVAPLAEAVAKLTLRGASIAANEITPAVGSPAQSENIPPPQPTKDAYTKTRRAGQDDYPRFERDGDKLVKVGWSKKDRREYEHRAPREAVFAVASRLVGFGRPGKLFSMETLLPFKGGAGGDIRSYQAYLALAWFRFMGAVEQRGKDGYSVANDALNPADLSTAWDNLAQK